VADDNGSYTSKTKCIDSYSNNFDFITDQTFDFSDLEFNSFNFGNSSDYQTSGSYYSPYTSSSLESLTQPTTNTNVAKTFRCDASTGYCSNKTSLTGKEYSSESECNKYCYKTSAGNETTNQE
jgi:hypothetical protein